MTLVERRTWPGTGHKSGHKKVTQGPTKPRTDRGTPSYDAKNLKRLFSPPPHFGADISYYTTIFCHSHIRADPRYGIYLYQIAGAPNKPTYAKKPQGISQKGAKNREKR